MDELICFSINWMFYRSLNNPVRSTLLLMERQKDCELFLETGQQTLKTWILFNEYMWLIESIVRRVILAPNSSKKTLKKLNQLKTQRICDCEEELKQRETQILEIHPSAAFTTSLSVKWGQPISSRCSVFSSVFGRCFLFAWLPPLRALRSWSEARSLSLWCWQNMWWRRHVCGFMSWWSRCLHTDCVSTCSMSCLRGCDSLYSMLMGCAAVEIKQLARAVSCVCVCLVFVCVFHVCRGLCGRPSLSWLGVINLWAVASEGASNKTSCFLQLSS